MLSAGIVLLLRATSTGTSACRRAEVDAERTHVRKEKRPSKTGRKFARLLGAQCRYGSGCRAHTCKERKEAKQKEEEVRKQAGVDAVGLAALVLLGCS